MNILIATRNIDKFNIMKTLLKDTIFKNDNIISLYDIKETIVDKNEIGDIEKRAYEKAFNVYNNLKKNIYDYIIGIDDGIEIKNKLIPNIKDYIDDIINNKYLKENEIIYIVRAHTIISKNGLYKNFIVKIPYKYKNNNNDIKILSNTYPLNSVLYPINSDTSISELSEKEANKYFIEYYNKILNDILNYFEKEEN